MVNHKGARKKLIDKITAISKKPHNFQISFDKILNIQDKKYVKVLNNQKNYEKYILNLNPYFIK